MAGWTPMEREPGAGWCWPSRVGHFDSGITFGSVDQGDQKEQTLGAKLRHLTKVVRTIQPEVVKAQINHKCETAAEHGHDKVSIRYEDLGVHWSQFDKLELLLREHLKTQDVLSTYEYGKVHISWPLPKDDS